MKGIRMRIMKNVGLRMAVALLVLGGGARAETPPLKSLGYVLQAEGLGASRADVVRRLAECGWDGLILDVEFDGSEGGRWTRDEVETIRAGKPGRKVLAYLSIGEAEDYRHYWRTQWDADRDGKPDAKAPPWLCEENPDWKGNYKVRYWDGDWQALMLGEVDALVRAGFDGVYLDIVDGFEFFEWDAARKDWIDNRKNSDTGNTFRVDMIRWVSRIAERARRVKPDFWVVPQNGVQLLESAEYRAVLDAIGVEDLFTNGNRIRKSGDTEHVLGFLAKAKTDCKPVWVIEYGTTSNAIQRSIEGARENGFLLLVTDRDLKTLGDAGVEKSEERFRLQVQRK